MRLFSKAIIFSIFLAGCSSNGGTPTAGGGGGILLAAGGCLLALLALGLFFLVMYAESRWRVLRLFQVGTILRRVPFLNRYLGQGIAMEQQAVRLQQSGTMVQRYAGDFKQAETGHTPDSVRSYQSFWDRLRGKPAKKESQTSSGGPAPAGTSPTTSSSGSLAPAGTTNQPLPSSPLLGQSPVQTTASAGSQPTPADGQPQTADGPFQPTPSRMPVSPEFRLDLATASAATEINVIGRRIDRYQVDSLLAEGHLSIGYQAYDLKMARPVYLKVIRPEFLPSAHVQEKLLEQIRAAALLDHPHLVQCYDYGVEQGHLFIVSEFVNGIPLDAYMAHLAKQNRPVGLTQILLVAAQIAQALSQIHRRGLVHGRLKPGHVLVEPQNSETNANRANPLRAELSDIGLLPIYDLLTATPDFFPYLAPEQWQNQPTDKRSDIYALGALLYYLTTERLPFPANSPQEAAQKHLNDWPPAPSQIRPGLPLAVERLIFKAMAKSPAERYQTAEAMAEELGLLARTLNDDLGGRPLYAGETILHVQSAGNDPRLIVMEHPTLFVGSASDNDIVLAGWGVADHHLRLERRGSTWRVIDLGSETGSFLEGARLLPEVAETWAAGQVLVIGSSFLSWEKVLETHRPNLPQTTEGPAGQFVGITLLPTRLTVEPGQRADMQIAIVNQGVHVDHFRLEMGGIPAGWIHISNNNLQLLPGNQGYLLLTVAPPRDSTAKAGMHDCHIVVTPVSYPAHAAKVSTELEILPFVSMAADLHPEQIRNKGVCQFTLNNQGNVTTQCLISGRDPAEEIIFDGQATKAASDGATEAESNGFSRLVEVPAGASLATPIPLAPKKRPWLGSSRQLPFELVAQPLNTPQPHPDLARRGQLNVQPRIPLWLLILLALLLAFCLIAAVFAAIYLDSRNRQAETEALANQTPPPTQPVQEVQPFVPPQPQSCADLYGQTTTPFFEGEYTVFAGGDPDKPFSVYCTNTDGTPKDYLSLVNVGELYNYSVIAHEGQQLVVHYTKVRINPYTLELDKSDRAFATAVGEVPENIPSEINDPDFGVAVGCGNDLQNLTFAQANIDLTGTAFVLDESALFGLFGFDAVGEGAIISPDRRVVTMNVSGRCGWVWPYRGLRLRYVGLPSNP